MLLKAFFKVSYLLNTIPERAKRLCMREERARLLAEGKEIPPELLYSGSSNPKYKDDEDSDDSRLLHVPED